MLLFAVEFVGTVQSFVFMCVCVWVSVHERAYSAEPACSFTLVRMCGPLHSCGSHTAHTCGTFFGGCSLESHCSAGFSSVHLLTCFLQVLRQALWSQLGDSTEKMKKRAKKMKMWIRERSTQENEKGWVKKKAERLWKLFESLSCED